MITTGRALASPHHSTLANMSTRPQFEQLPQHHWNSVNWKWRVQGDHARMLAFYRLAPAGCLHPGQLLAAVLPHLLPATSTVGANGSATALLTAARDSIRAAAAEACPRQPADVAAALDEALASPPHSGALEQLWGTAEAAGGGGRDTFSRSMSGAAPARPAAPAEARASCREFAAELRKVLEASDPASGGGCPGDERFPLLLHTLRDAGELRPAVPPGMAGLEGWPCGTDVAKQDDATSPGGCPLQREPAFKDWAKVAQIALTQLAGDLAELEALCMRPGVWATTDRDGEGTASASLTQLLVDRLQAGGQFGAAGLLLHATGRSVDAVELWLQAFDADREACLNGLPRETDAVPRPLSECRTLDEHVAAAAHLEAAAAPGAHAAGARALMAAARAAEALCDRAAVPELTERHLEGVLRMPSQCALAVLLARGDAARADTLFSPCHALDGGDDTAEAAAVDVPSLWLQVRYFRVCEQRETLPAAQWHALSLIHI